MTLEMPLPDIRGIEMRHLLALRAVADCGSFGRAAEKLGYTQSAVSQQVASLERIVGQKVFDRPGGPRPVVLTPAGALLLERGSEILESVAVTLADLDQVRNGERGQVWLGSFQSVSVHLAPPLLGRLRERYPLVDVRLYEIDDDHELERRLLSGELDATFLVIPPEGMSEGIDALELFTDPYLVLAPLGEPDGPFAATDLIERPMIGNPTGICERIVNDGLRANGVEASYEFRSGDNGAVQAMVRNGMGVAVMPRLAIDTSDPTVAIRELDPPVPARRVVIAWRSGTPGPLTSLVIDAAVEVARETGLGEA